MELRRIVLRSVFLIVLSLFTISIQSLRAQSIKDIVIKEHYWGVPLIKVLEDFKNKYGLKIEYDSAYIAPFKFDDKGRTSFGTSVEKAFYAICQDVPDLSFYIDDNDVVHLVKGSVPSGMTYVPKKITGTPQKKKSEKKKERKSKPEDTFINQKYTGKPKRKNITISGVIKDDDTGETLSFANIVVKGTTNGSTTNADGYFTLFNVPADTSTLEVSYIGYMKGVFHLNPDLDLSHININLKPNSSTLEEVVVTVRKESLMKQNSNEVGVVKMSPQKISELPVIGEKDIFRSFQLLPGVAGSNESSAGLFVLGGTPDQNLILYDGFTVYHVDHLFGMFSAFNSNAVKDVQLHKGGFGAPFGGRISSVMEIVGKDGNEKNFNIGGDIGFLSANVFTEIPVAKKLTVLLAARRSWKSFIYNDIFDSFNDATDQPVAQPPSGRPGGGGMKMREATTPSSYFYDLNAKITYKPTNKDKISYSFFNGLDNLDNSRDINRVRPGMSVSGGKTDITEWGNWGMSTTWSRKWNKKYYSNALVSISNYFSNRDMSMLRIMDDVEVSKSAIEDNNLRDYTFKFDNEYNINRVNNLEFGIQATHLTIDYNYTMDDTTVIQDRHDKGLIMAGYVQDRINLFEKLTIIPGVRLSYYDVTGKVYFEPRASVNYKLTNRITLKGAWGEYYQFANRIIRDDISNGSKDFWILSDGDVVPVSFAEHYLAGVSYETKDYLFSIEAYYKDLEGLSEYSLQYTPSFNNIDYDEFFYQGTGTAKGIEFLIQKKYGKYNGWISYTLGEVMYDFPVYGDRSFPANHDVTNEFKTVNTYRLKRWVFAGTWIYGTGKPYTEPVGQYSVTLLNGATGTYMDIGPKNGSRYPDYHRLDVSATFEFKLGKTGFGSIGMSIFNLYNRKNVWYKEFELEGDDLIETDVTLLGITPTLTLSFRLR